MLVSVSDFMPARAGTGEISFISKLLFLISFFKHYFCGSISYEFYVVKYMIRKYYRNIVGNLKGRFQVADISLGMTIIMKYIFKSEPGSSVGTATDYGLDGPGSNPSVDFVSSCRTVVACSNRFV